MTYTTDDVFDMSWDEYTYEIDMMLLADFGEPATFEQLSDATKLFEQGVPPHTAYAAIADHYYGGESSDGFDAYGNLAAA